MVAKESSKKKLRINWKWLALVVGVIVFGGGALAWRYHSQSDVTAAVYQARASEQIASKEWSKAAENLFRYLRFKPDDTDAWLNLTDVYSKLASSANEKERCVELCYQVLGRVGDGDARQETVRRRLAELLLELGRFDEVEDAAALLSPDDPVGLRVKALASVQTAKKDDPASQEAARQALQAAVAQQPADIGLATGYARMCRQEAERTGNKSLVLLADTSLDQMVAAESNRENAEAWLARHLYRNEFGLAGADDDLRQAIQLASSPELLASVGGAALARSIREQDAAAAKLWLEQSIQALQKAADAKPPAPFSYLGLGEAYLRQGESDRAIEVWEQGLSKVPATSLLEILDLRQRLAVLHLVRGDTQKSREQLEQLQLLADDAAPRARRYLESQRFLLELDHKVSLLRGRILLAEGKASEVVDQMSRLLDSLPAVPADDGEKQIRYQTLDTLGRGYLRKKQWRDAAGSLAAAADLYVDQGQAATLAAQAWQAAGDSRRAGEAIDQAIQSGASADVWITKADLELSRQLAQPVQGRDWSSFERALLNIQTAQPQDWRVNLLAAMRAVADPAAGGREEAMKQLTAAESLSPDDPALWERLMLIYEQLGLPEQANQARDRYASLKPGDWTVPLVESRLSLARGQFDAAINAVNQALANAPAGSKYEIKHQLARLERARNNVDEAGKILQQLADEQPDDTEVLQELAQLYLDSGNLAQLEEVETKLKGLEGDDGVFWRYYQAQRLLADRTRPASDALVDAGKLQHAIESRLPGWAPGIVLKGDIFTRHRQYADAATAYARAIEMGDRRLDVFERQLVALYASEQFDKAEALVGQLQNYILSSQTLAGLSAAIAAKTEHLPEAIARAEQLVKQRPKQAEARIWLASLLLMNGRDTDAEEELKEAVRIDRAKIGPWQALFTYYAARNPDFAAKVLAQMEKQSDILPPAQHALLMASNYQKLGKLDEARRFYEKAAQAEPNSTVPHLRMAAMSLNRDPALAETDLRRALEIDPNQKTARQMLAVLLATRGGQAEWEEVQRLLGNEQAGADEQTGDLRLRAILLMQRGGVENLAQARQSLEMLVAAPNAASPGDHLLLATIYETEGNQAGAEKEYEAILSGPTPDPRALFAYTDFWLRRGDLEKAGQSLDKLDQATAAATIAGRLLYLEAKTRLLVAAGQSEQVAPLVEGYAAQQEQLLKPDQKAERAGLYDAAGQLCMIAHQYPAAESWFRKLTEVAPDRIGRLTRALALQNRHSEAIDLVLPQGTPDTLPAPQVLIALTDILATGRPDPQAWERTEAIWQRAQEAPAEDLLATSLASTARAIQGRNDEAIAILERINQQRPDQPVVLNNLATLLGQTQGGQEQALKYIDRAIELIGPQAGLLDTKSLVLVEMGKPQEAVQILQHLVSVPRPDPRVLFRLAIAQLRAGSPGEARAIFARALALGLESQVLTVRDQELLQELRAIEPTS